MTVLWLPGPPAPEEEPWPTLGPQVVEYIEANRVFGPGDLLGEPYRMSEEWKAITSVAYEVYPEGHELAGRRRYKRVVISLAKGLAKTEWAAQIASVELDPWAPVRTRLDERGRAMFDGNGNPVGGPVTYPYIPMVAYTEEQTEELAYGALRQILELSANADDFDIGLERIVRRTDGGEARALASSPNARDGARTTFQHFDEPLALDTPVPTPDGWKTIGDLAAGDYVYGRDGAARLVLGASPVHQGRACYRITFSDGSTVVTDAQHRWKAIEWSNRPAGEQVVTTEQMALRGLRTGYGWRWWLPRAAGYDGTNSTLPIDPYLLGLWLGDGGERAGYIHSKHSEYPELSCGIEHTTSTARAGMVRWLPVGLRSMLRRVGVLTEKHIPDEYLFAGRAQRLALLQGLMDADGHTTRGGSCTFVQARARLAEQVALLVRSLGAEAMLVRTDEPRSRRYGETWKVHFSPPFCPFRLRAKAGRAEWGPRRSTAWPAIVAIDPVGSVPVRCIAVDGDDHLFLVGRGLHLTHNTHRFVLPNLKRAHQTMLQNIPKRFIADAWTLETTTAYAPGERSIAEDAHEYARQVAAGRRADSGIFYFHREASDRHDVTTTDGRRDAVREASGPSGGFRDIEGVVRLYDEPGTDKPYWERVWCNRSVQEARRAFDVARWKELSRPDLKPEDGAFIVLAFDGSRFYDATSISARDIATGYSWQLGLWERPEGVEHWEVPRAEVDGIIRDAFERYDVWRLYADPPNWQGEIAAWAGEFGSDRVIEWWTNRRKQMAYAIKAYVTDLAAGNISNSGDPDIARHLGNAHKEYTQFEDEDTGERLWIIRKERPDSPFKIDAAMTEVLSSEARNDAIAAGATPSNAPSVYEERGLRRL